MKFMLLAWSLLLAGCGYSTVYQTTADAVQSVAVAEVVVNTGEKLPGERRVAQLVNRRLAQVFTSHPDSAAYTLHIHLDEEQRTLAVLRDATEDRFEVVLTASLSLKDHKGEQVFHKVYTTTAIYNVEPSPLSTDAGRERARQSAAEFTSREAIQYINFFLHEQKRNGDA